MNGRDVFRFGAFTLALGERRLSAGGSGPSSFTNWSA
jgi:hypothetical protein